MTEPLAPENAPAPPPRPAAAPALSPSPRLVTVSAINWPGVLDFTHLFRGFRLAINPAKLMIALLAIMLIYFAGRAFDWVWGPQVYRDEIPRFVSLRPEVYAAQRVQRVASRAEELNRLLRTDSSVSDERRETLKNDPAAARKVLAGAYREQFDKLVQQAADERVTAEKMLAASPPTAPLPPGRTPVELEEAARRLAAERLLGNMRSLDDAVGHGIFDTFLKYETGQFDRLVENTLTFVRVSPVRSADNGDIDGQAVTGGLLSRDPERLWRSDTILGCIANMAITGPEWLFTGTAPIQYRADNDGGGAGTWGGWMKMLAHRGFYLLSLGMLAIFSLLMLAFAGASIARLSALELAGIERPPLKDVFLFAFRRLWVFVKAPTVPFIILLAIGLIIALVSMVGAIPWIGPIIIGAALFVFLAVSFILMLLLLGILGGFNLLYPTIAVEGADSFDAMSRSFAYVYARPWRLLFYTVTALIYGVITFLFVSFAVYLILLITHTFVGWGMNLFGSHYGAYSGSPALDTLWPSPQFLHLVSPINWYAMSWPEFLGAILLHFWVFLLITGIGAYVISYYFSSHTIMYLLLRRSVDGQNLRDVYMEEPAK